MSTAKGQVSEKEAVPRLIPLPKGQWALVDACLFDYLNQWKWQAYWCEDTRSYYAIRCEVSNGRKTEYKMHRIVLGLERGNPLVADHINHNTLDNRTSNLRKATHAQNAQNRRTRRDNLCGLKGVGFHKAQGKWRARIMLHGKSKQIGYFDTAEQAHEAYRAESVRIFGEFARHE